MEDEKKRSEWHGISNEGIVGKWGMWGMCEIERDGRQQVRKTKK